jgi:DNA-binding HxlR family transcriptional regulator
MATLNNKIAHNSEECVSGIVAVKDALYVLNGKWKLPLIIALQDGPKRFKDIQRALGEITPRVLSKELKELELNEFIERKVYTGTPLTVTYNLTGYSESLDKVLMELRRWGMQHRQRIMKKTPEYSL